MHALAMSSAIAVWAAHFTALYGFTAFACARGLAGAVPWVGGGATLAALAAMAFIIVRAAPRRAEFTAWMTLGIAALSLVGVIYQAVPFFIVPICA